MNWTLIFAGYLAIGLIVSMANLFNAISSEDPDRPVSIKEFVLFFVSITVFWPCTLGFMLVQLFMWRR